MTDFKNYNGENIEVGLQATITSDGLISAADKVKLNGIATGANAYIHPTTHPASIIVQDANNRFVTDAEKAAWNAKASTAVVTTTTNGLMIAADKVKLNGIATGANVYTHPTTHPASIIVQDANNRFVTDAEKTKWNNSGNSSYEYAFHSATNSYYKKYADGTVDMYGKFNDPLMAPTTNSGGMYISSIYTITYPVALLDGSYAHFTFTPQGNYPYIIYTLTGTNYSTKTGISFRIAASATAAKDFTAVIHWRVVGRWK